MKKILFLTFLLFISWKSFALTLTLEVSKTNGLTSPNGAYIKILDKAIARTKHKLKYNFYPPTRAHKKFLKDKKYCNLPGALDISSIKNPLFSPVFMVATFHAFSRASDAVVKSKEQLKNKVVAIHRGWPKGVAKEIPFKRSLLVDNIEQLYKLLLSEKPKRVDYALIYQPDFNLAFDKEKRKKVHYDKEFVLNHVYDRIVCFNTDKNKLILKDLNRELDKMKKNGELNKLLIQAGAVVNK